MASQMIYSNPFGAMAEGQLAGQKAGLEAGTSARQFEAQDISNAFQKWYQPLREATAQNETGTAIAKTQAALMHYGVPATGFNTTLQNYFGATVPEGFNNEQPSAAQIGGADLATGLFPIPLAHPDVFGANNVYRVNPVNTAPSDPRTIEAAIMAHKISMAEGQRRLDELNAPKGTGDTSYLRFANPQGSAGMPAATPAPASTPMPAPAPAIPAASIGTPKSIWADENSGVGP